MFDVKLRILIPLFMFLSFACSKKNEVEIYQQWHLLPNQNTLDLEAAKKIPQYNSQIALYQELKEKIEEKEISILIAEGCEGVIDKNFQERFNGWTLKDLEVYKDDKKFSSILAPVQMKLKVKFPELEVICGDSMELIAKNQLFYSEMQGHLGFLSSLIQNYKVNFQKYHLYKKKYLEILPIDRFSLHPILYAKKEVEKNLDSFLKMVKERNNIFVERIKDIRNEPKGKIAVVIGAVHANDLEKKLSSEFTSSIIGMKEANVGENGLIQKLKESLQNIKIPDFFVYSQMPEKFDIKKFPIKNNISEEKMLNAEDKDELLKLSHYYQLNFDFMRSDFDQDGIRDFTISNANDFLVIAAEDTDWDNDGRLNLVDPDVDNKVIAEISELKTSNKFNLENPKFTTIKKWFQDRKITLISSESTPLDLLSLFLFRHAYELFKTTPEVKFIRSLERNPDGRDVFFSYIKHTKTIEFYTNDFYAYTEELYAKRFKEVTKDQYIKEVVSLIIIQSLIHELSHSINVFTEEDFKEYGWSFKKTKLDSLYLTQNREPLKVLEFIYEDLKFKNHTFDYYKKIILQKQTIKNLKSYQSHLEKIGVPSLYSLSTVAEWESEISAACGLSLLYPKLASSLEGKRWELLIDFNPYAKPEGVCKRLPLGP